MVPNVYPVAEAVRPIERARAYRATPRSGRDLHERQCSAERRHFRIDRARRRRAEPVASPVKLAKKAAAFVS